MSEAFFGGPDRPARFLRDLLEQKIHAIPSGGSIHWATYYFRDRALAQALMAASDRGVRIVLRIEGRPRNAAVNRAVTDMLRQHGLGGGLRIHHSRLPKQVRPYLHSKVYAFSHPVPAALVGSFNPSGDVPEDPAILADIGDQDRGHNVLVEYREPKLVRGLVGYVAELGSTLDRLRPFRWVADGPTTMWFYPRLRSGIIDRQLAPLGAGTRIRGAISHMKQNFFAPDLALAAQRGASVRLIVHDTSRRVPDATFAMLADAGVSISRYARPDGVPLHAKILLVETPDERSAWFGSFNYNRRSRYFNHELLVRSRDPALYDRFAARLDEIEGELSAPADGPSRGLRGPAGAELHAAGARR